MSPSLRRILPVFLLVAIVAAPTLEGVESPRRTRTLVLAGGCFWGVESVFRHVRGVTAVVSGYAVPGIVESGPVESGHVEAVRLTYDPARISYRQLLAIFFTVVHDPTEGDRQGPDVGPQYRSVLFVAGGREDSVARAYVDALRGRAGRARPITTAVATLGSFVPAEAYHQDYAARHPDDPYIVTYDEPKLVALRHRFPALFRERAGSVERRGLTPSGGRPARR